MTSIQRKRLHAELDRAAYRARVARQIGILLALAGLASLLMVALMSCSTPPGESRPAVIQLTEADLRDARGRYKSPVHAITHEPAVSQQTVYRTPRGAEMHGPVYRIRSSEIPPLTAP